ncbi:hypothetical protein QZH41_014024, partial [Actinostola sp. cb2023]
SAPSEATEGDAKVEAPSEATEGDAKDEEKAEGTEEQIPQVDNCLLEFRDEIEQQKRALPQLSTYSCRILKKYGYCRYIAKFCIKICTCNDKLSAVSCHRVRYTPTVHVIRTLDESTARRNVAIVIDPSVSKGIQGKGYRHSENMNVLANPPCSYPGKNEIPPIPAGIPAFL